MNPIRPASPMDLERIAEIYVFCYRMNFYPIFQNDEFYFGELQVSNVINTFREDESFLRNTLVYDDGAVKGFLQADGAQVKKLFVEPVLHGNGIGSRLLEFAIAERNVSYLWALEKNTRAIAFYRRHGFSAAEERIPEDGTSEYLVKLVRSFR